MRGCNLHEPMSIIPTFIYRRIAHMSNLFKAVTTLARTGNDFTRT